MEGRPANRDWPVALTGAAFIVLLIVGIIIQGELPSTEDDSAEEIVNFYVDNESSVIAGIVLMGLAAVSVLFFGGYLREVFRSAEGERGNTILSTMVAAATVVLAVGIAIDATITAALVSAADDIDPTAVQALQALWDNDFLPIALGILVLLLTAGLSIVRHAAAPVWLGWVAIVLVAAWLLAAATNFDAFWVIASLGSALWVLVLSVLLAVRRRKAVA